MINCFDFGANGAIYPQFCMCQKCGKHGVIFLNDHSHTNSLYTKEDAINCLNFLVENEMIEKYQTDLVINQVMKTSLPETNEEINITNDLFKKN